MANGIGLSVRASHEQHTRQVSTTFEPHQAMPQQCSPAAPAVCSFTTMCDSPQFQSRDGFYATEYYALCYRRSPSCRSGKAVHCTNILLCRLQTAATPPSAPVDALGLSPHLYYDRKQTKTTVMCFHSPQPVIIVLADTRTSEVTATLGTCYHARVWQQVFVRCLTFVKAVFSEQL